MTTDQLQVAFIDLGAERATIEDAVNEAIARVLARTDFVLGQDVARFEEEFAAYCDARYAVGVDSGTSALELALRASGIGPGDQVLLPANTFIATALAVSMVGARPVLVDINPDTFTIDVDRLREAITPRARAILPVHLYGQPANMDAILDVAERRGLIVIEDAAQAHGARYNGQRAGTMGLAAGFSFYPAKNLGAYGDGGMVVTNDERVAEQVRMMRSYGQREKYHHVSEGYNRRLDTLQAAILRAKLPHLDAWNDARRDHARRYAELLSGTGVIVPQPAPYAEHVWHLYVIRTAHRDALRQHLGERGIATGLHYPIPIHLQPTYKHLGYKRGDFPVTEQSADEILTLPMYPLLPDAHIDAVADAIRAFAADHALAPAGLPQAAG